MIILKKSLISICFFMTVVTTHAQTGNVKFSVDQLKEDYHIFVNALKEAHPGLYRYTSKEKFEKLFGEMRRKIDHDMNEEEFYRLLTPLIASIKCGHTKFHRQDKPDDRFPFHHDKLFPLKLYFVNGKAYVLYSYDTALHILPGTQVVTISGKTIPEIMRMLRKYITVDGDVQSALYEELNHSFNGYYATFMENKNEYNTIYRENGQRISSTLSTVNLDEINKGEAQNIPENKLPLRLTYPADSIALLTIESFYVDATVQKFYPFIDSAFCRYEK